MSRFLGIDIGTTFLKGAVLDLDGRTVSPSREVRMPEPVPGLPPTRYELDPAAVLAAVRRLLGELLREAPDAAGLVTCSQMHGLVMCDEEGTAWSNVITWRDRRVLEPAGDGPGTVFDALNRTVRDEERHEIGNELRIGVPVTTLYWLRRREWQPGSLYPASLPDFVLANLCGVEPTTEPTNAAAHGLFHLYRGDWHRGLIARLGLDSLRWPGVRRFGEAVGVAEIDGRWLTCFTPVGDQQCALVGAALADRELSLNVATGSQVSLLTRGRPAGEFQVRPYFDGKWLRTVVQIPAGRALDQLVGLLTEIGGGVEQAWQYIQGVAEQTPDTDLEVDLGFFDGRGGGWIRNIREGNLTVGHLFAAAFRGMAGNFADFAGRLSPGREWDRVAFSGGLARRFPRLRKEILARLGGTAPVRVTDNDTLCGLLALALVCDGRAATVGEAARMVTEAQ